MQPIRRTAPRFSAIEALESRIAPASTAVFNLGDIHGRTGFKLVGGFSETIVDSVSGAGDVNGDGFDDLLIGTSVIDFNADSAGICYLVFGKAGGFGAALKLSDLNGRNGVKLSGLYTLDSANRAGDINGDGFDDLVIASHYEGGYVVFGKAGGFDAVLDLSRLNGHNGFRFSYRADGGIHSADAAGDVNGDGFDDLIVNSYSRTSVIFGRAGSFGTSLLLSTLDGSNGFTLQGPSVADEPWSVSGAGDVNGDGFDDLVVGRPEANEGGFDRGAVHVVFGKASGFSAVLSLSTLDGSNGFKLSGSADDNQLGRSVNGAGDVNRDGFDDLIIGAPSANATYVIFGKAGGFGATMAVSALDGSNGFKLAGEANGDRSGYAVSGAGDVNGDGFADLLIGAPSAEIGAEETGAAYVVFGKPGAFAPAMLLSALDGHNGFKLAGAEDYDGAGKSVGGAGDINGDGLDDVVIGQNFGGYHSGHQTAAYVVFGSSLVSPDGKTARWLDSDGDAITVKTSKGHFKAEDFHFADDCTLQSLDLHRAGFTGANITITARTPIGGAGDGKINVGYVDARGVDLGIVRVAGDLGQIDAGDDNIRTPGIRLLKVQSLGTRIDTQPVGTINPFQSDIVGALGTLKVAGDLQGFLKVGGSRFGDIGTVKIGGDLDGSAGGTNAGLVRAGGDIGTVKIKGSMLGGSDLSGVLAGSRLGTIRIAHDFTSADPSKPVIVSALGKLGATSQEAAVAISAVEIGGNVLNARILAGYSTSLGAVNGDASIGSVSVRGDWTASSLVAGVRDVTGDGFGRNDALIDHSNATPLAARLGRVAIVGTAIGSQDTGDFFGITAQRFGALVLGGVPQDRPTIGNDVLLDVVNTDFRYVDFGVVTISDFIDLASLDGHNGFHLSGKTDDEYAGNAVSNAGDINGDGFDDIIIGTAPTGYSNVASYVVFGKSGGFDPSLNLSKLDGRNGFKFLKNRQNSEQFAVSGAGDVNGDGFDDLIIGAPNTNVGGEFRGACFVVFGKARGFAPTFDLSDLDGTDGFKLVGAEDYDGLGLSVSGAGDINGDGFDDVVIGTEDSFQDFNDPTRGFCYVVYGKAGGFSKRLAVSALDGSNGFKLLSGRSDSAGFSVAGAGDINGDGLDDLVIGAPKANPSGGGYVVFGKTYPFSAVVKLSALNGRNGFKLLSAVGDSLVGDAVSGAGDINGDGFDDLIVNGYEEQSRVVFGRAGGFDATLDLAALDGTNGFKIFATGEPSGYNSISVTAAGDIDGDGFADLVVVKSFHNEREKAYIVFGKAGTFNPTLNLSELDGLNGFKLLEAANASFAAAAAGDFNGDGFADLIVGYGDNGINHERGAAYVILDFSLARVRISKDGHTATMFDNDGDRIFVQTTKGHFKADDFIRAADGSLQKIDLSHRAQFSGASITITARTPKGGAGDGRVHVGAIDATGVDLGVVKVEGDLGQIDAGDSDLLTAGLKRLEVMSLGRFSTYTQGDGGSLQSKIIGPLHTLDIAGSIRSFLDVHGNLDRVNVGGSLTGRSGGSTAGLIRAAGDIGVVSVQGGIIGGANLSGILAGGKLGTLDIGQNLASADANKPVIISALGQIGATDADAAVAINTIQIAGNVLNARILAGYTTHLIGANGDASIGSVIVGGNWAASSLVAGIRDSGNDGFGPNDAPIDALGLTPLIAKIASVMIHGTATGSADTGDSFAITAQLLGALSIGGVEEALSAAPQNLLLDPANRDFRAVDFA